MSLEYDLAGWDGKSIHEIRALHDRYAAQPNYGRNLVAMLGNPGLEKGASWLIKHHLENGGWLDDLACRLLVDALAGLQGWESRLHGLQLLVHIRMSSAQAETIAEFVRESLRSHRPFVRAWAVNAFHVLASTHPAYEAEMIDVFETALKDEAGSVKARIRNILKAGKKDDNGRGK